MTRLPAVVALVLAMALAACEGTPASRPTGTPTPSPTAVPTPVPAGTTVRLGTSATVNLGFLSGDEPTENGAWLDVVVTGLEAGDPAILADAKDLFGRPVEGSAWYLRGRATVVARRGGAPNSFVTLDLKGLDSDGAMATFAMGSSPTRDCAVDVHVTGPEPGKVVEFCRIVVGPVGATPVGAFLAGRDEARMVAWTA